MKYTIKGKEYTEFDINKRCDEIMGLKVSDTQWLEYADRDVTIVTPYYKQVADSAADYCNNWNDAGPIIEKCWDELNRFAPNGITMVSKWRLLMDKHNCTKLEAACICHIEINHSETI